MTNENGLKKHVSPLGLWAFSIGTSVGWGALVVTANAYLAKAGPLGSVLGLTVGGLIMLLVGWNYAYLMRCYPDAGGAYAYAREAFGHDYAFLTGWFLAITYFAILWANATSLPLFARVFLGGAFRFGRLYTLFGYDVYLGEALLSAAALALAGLLCARRGRAAQTLMIVLACLFTAGIAVCLIGAVAAGGAPQGPAFLPDASAVSQAVRVALMSPWAFIGFESVSHSAEEFDFDRRRVRRLLLIAVVCTLALYILVTLLSVTAYPPEYESWTAYIRDLDRLDGLKALPAFYAADHYLGGFGVGALTLSLLALVVTSLIGNITALSRLFYALARERVLPERFARVNADGSPAQAVLLAVGMSMLIPLLGRTAVEWIVDVTTIGATLIYGLVAACAARTAKKTNDRREARVARASLCAMAVFGASILLPNLISKGTLSKETYLLFVVWSVLGFVSFRYILHRDRERRFGASIIVWLGILALLLFASLIWMRQSMIASNESMQTAIHRYYERTEADEQRLDDERFVQAQLSRERKDDTRTILVAVGMFSFALVIILTNHTYMNKRSQENERLAVIDPMTGVKNKHAYLLAEEKLDKSIRENAAQPFAIAVCDVNGLKKINDTQGHKAGDDYIRDACKMVCEIFAHSPVYRVGGDEFAAVITGRDYLVRGDLAQVLHDRSVDHIANGGAVVSVGISDYLPGDDTGAHDVFGRADKLMYEEKKLLKGLGATIRDESEEQQAQAAEAETGAGIEPMLLNLRRSLLIVEDEVINMAILSAMLRDDYELICAADGVEALEMLRANADEIAMILLDLRLPRMDGIEVLRRVKDNPDTRGIPVIVLTSEHNAEAQCLKLGAMDFIPKPYPSPEVIRARVAKCIELSETREIISSTERDSLTTLFNVDYFMRYVKVFDRHYADKPMDALAVDVNHFHMLKERYGKQYGSLALRRVGKSLRAVARQIGGVGCLHGADTFLLYCPHRDEYASLLERITDGYADDAEMSARVRLRMGVYANVDKTLDIETRFDYARIAANTVRGSYLKAVGIYDAEMQKAELLKARLLEDFYPSLQNRRFAVYFQPKFDIRPEKPVLASAEALVRWDHPEMGFLQPSQFIPILEENGLILELDKFVWRETAARIREWKDRLGYSVPVSVNVSRIDMLTPNLKDIFGDILSEFSLTTADFALELTESAYTGDSEQVISAAKELRGMGMGFRIEMDDFGSGYSSLGMLTSLPIDALKLDMSFIRSAFGEMRDVRMIELVADIADYLHVPMVAEGVETEEQYHVLKALGCELVQGYYFSRPVPPEQFDRFLLERGPLPEEAPRRGGQRGASISKALSGAFEYIFYIDTDSDFYLEFHTGGGEFEIYPGGADFFGQARERLLADVQEEDAPAVSAALSRENLRAWTGSEETFSLTYRRCVGDVIRRWRMQTVRTRSTDDHHIMLGFRAEE